MLSHQSTWNEVTNSFDGISIPFLKLPLVRIFEKVGNIEYRNFDFEKVYFENGKFKFNFELDMGCGGGGGVGCDDVKGCYDPVLVVF